MEFKPDATVRIPVKQERDFFKYWLEFLKPFHNLTKREMDVAVSFIYNRYLLELKISDEDLLDETVINETTKRKVREECNITLAHFQVIMGKLKQSKIFDRGKLNPKFIPSFKKENDSFQLLFLFDLT